MEKRGILYLAKAECMLLAFDSTQQALRAEMLLEYANISIDIRPTPKEITAGCALSIDFPAAELQQVQEIVRLEKVELRGIFRRVDGGFEEIE
jgi:hypothetical protein